MTRVIRDPI